MLMLKVACLIIPVASVEPEPFQKTQELNVFLLEDSGTKFCFCTIVPGIKGGVRSIHLLPFVNTTFELGPSSRAQRTRRIVTSRVPQAPLHCLSSVNQQAT